MIRTILCTTAMLVVLTGCGPSSETSSTSPDTSAGGLRHVQTSVKPEITTDKIMADIVGREVTVSEIRGTLRPTKWTFDASEFRHADILEKRMTDTAYTIVIFMTTRSNHREDEDDVQVSGRLQLYYEWTGGQWRLRRIENLTFRYSLGQST